MPNTTSPGVLPDSCGLTCTGNQDRCLQTTWARPHARKPANTNRVGVPGSRCNAQRADPGVPFRELLDEAASGFWGWFIASRNYAAKICHNTGCKNSANFAMKAACRAPLNPQRRMRPIKWVFWLRNIHVSSASTSNMGDAQYNTRNIPRKGPSDLPNNKLSATAGSAIMAG